MSSGTPEKLGLKTDQLGRQEGRKNPDSEKAIGNTGTIGTQDRSIRKAGRQEESGLR
jgi:hypothetical protein